MKRNWVVTAAGCIVVCAGCTNASKTLLDDLDDANPTVRCNAASVLGRRYLCGSSRLDNEPAVEIVVGKLIKHLADEDVEVRGCAATAIQLIGPEAKDAVPILAKMLKEHDEATGWAVVALGGIGPAAIEALPELLEVSHSDDYLVRRNTLQSIRLIAPRDGRTLDALKRGLKDEVPSVRAEAAFNLGCLGSAAATAIPSLRLAATDTDNSVANAATEALLHMQD